MAQSTTIAYENALSVFDTFRLKNHMEIIWPPHLEQLVKFIAYSSLNNRAPRTVKLYVSGIGFHCKLKNVEDVTQKFIVRKLLNGLERSVSMKDSRLPVTLDLLHKILSVLPVICLSKYEEIMFKALFTTAFFGFMRVSEPVASNKNSISEHVLLTQNIAVDSGFLRVFISSSKTDQQGKGVSLNIPVVKGQCCPVTAVQQFMRIRPPYSGPFFCHFSGQPVTRYQFSAVLKKALSSLGIGNLNIRSHSFRIGAATEAALAGLPDKEIRILGRWQSSTFKSYIRIPVTRLVSSSLHIL